MIDQPFYCCIYSVPGRSYVHVCGSIDLLSWCILHESGAAVPRQQYTEGTEHLS